jgi:hypothetical protein
LLVDARTNLVTADLPGILEQTRGRAGGAAIPLIVARFLGPTARDWLERNDVSYADATGNLRILVDQPALFLRDRGADRDPWRGRGRPRGNLAGPPGARVVRALVDFATPMAVTDLVELSGASTGATYRTIEFLEAEGLVRRAARGRIETVEWRSLLERWSRDYGFQQSNSVSSYLEPRGLPAFMDRLSRSEGLTYAVTGTAAVQRYAPYAAARLAMVYVDDVTRAATTLGLRPVDAGANILLASGNHDVVFDRTVTENGLTLVAPSQAAVDLLTGPGRSPAEAEALLDWMETHQSDWRRPAPRPRKKRPA